MNNQKLLELFVQYEHVRNTNLTSSQFKDLLRLYPSLKICLADGVLDVAEWQGLLNMASAMSAEFTENDGYYQEMLQLLNQELLYLMGNMRQWDTLFMDALEDYLYDHSDEKQFVEESMYLFANAADGISRVESFTIGQISQRLGLSA